VKNQKKAYLYALSTVLLWSTVSTAFKISLKSVDFIQLLFFGVLVSIVIMIGIALFQGQIKILFSPQKKDLLKSAANGFLNPFLYYIMLLKAYSVLPAQIAQPLNYLWPVMLVLLSVPLLGQKLTTRSFIGIVCGFVGVYIISTQGNIFGFKISSPLGVALAAGSSVIWALYWILNQKDKRNEVNKLFWNFVFGLIYTTISFFLFSSFTIPSSIGLFAVIYVGFFELGITFFLWMKALQYTESNDKISNLIFLSPFLALIFISFILHEKIYYTTILGLVFIILGIMVQQLKKR